MVAEDLVVITPKEKAMLCKALAKHMPKLRKLLRLSQKEFGLRAGVSVDRVSLIENGHFQMTWSQFTSFLFIFSLNKLTKEYFVEHKLIDRRVLQYLQAKRVEEEPEMSILLTESISSAFNALNMGDVIARLKEQKQYQL